VTGEPMETDYVIEEMGTPEGQGPPALEMTTLPSEAISTPPALEPSWGKYIPADLAPPPLENAEPALDSSDGVVDLEELEGEQDAKMGPGSLTASPGQSRSNLLSPSNTTTPIRGPGGLKTYRKGDLPKIMGSLQRRGLDTNQSRYQGRKSQSGSVSNLMTPSLGSLSEFPTTSAPNSPSLPGQIGGKFTKSPSTVLETDEY